MGCTNSLKKVEVNGQKTDQLDVAVADSEDEIFSTKPMVKSQIDQQNLTKKTMEFSTGLTTANVNASSTNSTLLDNRLQQTSV